VVSPTTDFTAELTKATPGTVFKAQVEFPGSRSSFPSFASVFPTEGNEENEEPRNQTCEALESMRTVLLRSVTDDNDAGGLFQRAFMVELMAAWPRGRNAG
jgi:hypothetical protein